MRRRSEELLATVILEIVGLPANLSRNGGARKVGGTDAGGGGRGAARVAPGRDAGATVTP
jgi:hypothetical protein